MSSPSTACLMGSLECVSTHWEHDLSCPTVTPTLIHTMTMRWRPSGEEDITKTSECSTRKLLFPTTTA